MKKRYWISIVIFLMIFVSAGCSHKNRSYKHLFYDKEPDCFYRFPVSYSFDRRLGKLELTFSPHDSKNYPGAEKFIVILFDSDYVYREVLEGITSKKSLDSQQYYRYIYFGEFSRFSPPVTKTVPITAGKTYTLAYYIETNGKLTYVCSTPLTFFTPLKPELIMWGFLYPSLITDYEENETLGGWDIATREANLASPEGISEYFATDGVTEFTNVSDFSYTYFPDSISETSSTPRLVIGYCYQNKLEKWKCVVDKKLSFSLYERKIVKAYPLLFHGKDERTLNVLVLDKYGNLMKYTAVQKNGSRQLSLTTEVLATRVIDIAPRINMLKDNWIGISFYFYYVTGSSRQYVTFLDLYFSPVTTVSLKDRVKKLLWIYTDKSFSEKDLCYINENNEINCPIGGFKLHFNSQEFIPEGGTMYFKWGNNPYVLNLMGGDGSMMILSIGGYGVNGGEKISIFVKKNNDWRRLKIVHKRCCSTMIITNSFWPMVFSLTDEFYLFNELSYLPFGQTFPVSSSVLWLKYKNGYYWAYRETDCDISSDYFESSEDLPELPIGAIGGPDRSFQYLKIKNEVVKIEATDYGNYSTASILNYNVSEKQCLGE